MPDPVANSRTIITLADDQDQRACTYDTEADPFGPLILQGYKIHEVRTIILGPAADDQVLAFTDVSGLLLYSDQPFSLRLADAETLIPNLRKFEVWCDDVDAGALSTSVLLTGNATAEATIKAILVEKV